MHVKLLTICIYVKCSHLTIVKHININILNYFNVVVYYNVLKWILIILTIFSMNICKWMCIQLMMSNLFSMFSMGIIFHEPKRSNIVMLHKRFHRTIFRTVHYLCFFQVHIISHIPFGVSGTGRKFMINEYNNAFNNLICEYSKEIMGVHAGHSHLDEFKLFCGEGLYRYIYFYKR